MTGSSAAAGHSFPSGHPLATAASWCMLPLVVALYTRRRVVWWSVAIGVWTLAVLVAVSRVWLGVHWASDVVAGLALAVLGIALVERLILADECGCREASGGEAERRGLRRSWFRSRTVTPTASPALEPASQPVGPG